VKPNGDNTHFPHVQPSEKLTPQSTRLNNALHFEVILPLLYGSFKKWTAESAKKKNHKCSLSA
jgi:hypothetical protein